MREDAEKGSNAIFTVDLVDQEIIRPDGSIIDFEVDEFRKHCLIDGLDDIELTMKKIKIIRDFEQSYSIKCPWL